ncbi:aldo/keto reductase [Acidothermaceae bacterium B102]|nr:aldo/keto reductase [Acidothermaceae bacterium B102]
MRYRRLGRLGHQSSVIIYGAAALGEVSQDTADASVQLALDAGINHLDVAASYGEAELRLGSIMPAIRDRVFLATKTGDRGYEAAWASINRSLERLQTDHVDLLQLHAIGDLDELDLVFADDGALKAAVRAQEEGLVGAVGLTGHGHEAPATHLEGLRRFPFATILTPWNPLLARMEAYAADFWALVAEVQRQDAGLMTIKTVSRRNWAEGAERPYTTWYEPFSDDAPITAAVAWALSFPEITGIPSAGDVRLLPAIIRAEEASVTITREQADALLVPVHADPFYESPFFDIPI